MEIIVNKFVEKVVEKMWTKNVKKCGMWNSSTKADNSTLSFTKNIDTFCTWFSSKLPLLKSSFTTYAHRTTNTTILLIKGMKNNF